MTGLPSSRIRATALLLLVFAAGGAAGVAGERLWLGRAAAGEAAGESDGRRATVIERFADDIGLTAEQRARIDSILERSHERFQALFKGIKPRYEALIDSVRGEIEAELTPDQVERYRAILREQEEKEKARERAREEGKTKNEREGGER